MDKGLNRPFSEENIKTINKHMKQCSTFGKCKSKPQ